MAVQGGCVGYVDELTKIGANANVRDDRNNTALCLAAEFGHFDVVEALLKANATIDARCDGGRTALACAAGLGRTRIVRRLIQARADLNSRAAGGMTALYAAARNNHPQSLKALLEAKADPNLGNGSPGRVATPLYTAIAFRRHKMARWLVESGADLDDNGMGWTALIEATRIDDLEMVKLLVQAGANVDSLDELGRNAFMIACQNSSIEVVKYLRSAGSWMHLQDTRGLTALHLAAVSGSTSVVKVLLEWKIFDVDVRTSYGRTPLHYAAWAGSGPACRLLIDAGADLNAQFSLDGIVWTVADVVAAGGELDVMRLLIDSGLVFRGDADGGLLGVAALNGRRTMCEFLMNATGWSGKELEVARRALAHSEQGRPCSRP
jgi:serine/threonine-protein phosphatase 6 regulatory ankyrin repeat subunit B